MQQLREASFYFLFRMRFPINIIGSISSHMHRHNSSDFSWAADSPLLLFYSLWVHTFCLFFLSFFFYFGRIEIRTPNTYVNEANCANDTNVHIFFTTIDAFGSLSVRILKCVKFILWWYTKDNAPIVQSKNESVLRI